MEGRAESTYRVKSWNEDAVVEIDGGGKLTRASVTAEYTGDVEGEARTESVMTYRPDGTARYVGMERVVGRVAGRSGSFVMRSDGSYDGSEARSSIEIVAGSGTGELSGIAGAGRFVAPHGPEGRLELDYRFE